MPCCAVLCVLCADGEAYIGEDFLVPGSTPLHIAVIVTNVSIVHAILQVGADRPTGWLAGWLAG